jgi:putative flippase GtrA
VIIAPPETPTVTRPWLARVAELARFGSVGAVGYVVNAGLFNLLQFGPGHLLGDKTVTAKIISVCAATMVAWIGNRYWTFAASRREERGRELIAFAVVNVVGLLIEVGALAFTVYVLDMTSPLAKNISGNIVGVGLGTIFRYFAYKRHVFTGTGADPATPPQAP